MVFTAWEPRLSPRTLWLASGITLAGVKSSHFIWTSTADESTNFPWDNYWFLSSIVIYSSPELKNLYLRARFLVGAWFSRLGRQKKRVCPQSAFRTTVQGGKWALIILSTSSSKLVIYRQEIFDSSWARIHFLLMSPISCLKYSIFQVVRLVNRNL